MTPSLFQKTYMQLLRHEDDKKRAYLDEFGNITVGLGHNLSARDVEDDIRFRWAKEDIIEFYTYWSDTFPWFLILTENRQSALIDFSFMGWQKVLGFKKMLACLGLNDMEGAARELLNSEYAKQVGKRAQDIAHTLVTDEMYQGGSPSWAS